MLHLKKNNIGIPVWNITSEFQSVIINFIYVYMWYIKRHLLDKRQKFYSYSLIQFYAIRKGSV